MLLELDLAQKLELQQIEDWVLQITWPRRASGNVLSSGNVVLGYSPQRDSHLKLFGAETLGLLCALKAFTQIVIVPTGRIPDHVRCFLLLATIVDILCLADNALQFMGVLEQATREHFVLMGLLYPNICKPKLHLLFHVLQWMRKHQANLSTAPCEKQHKSYKAQSQRSTGAHQEIHPIRKVAAEILEGIGGADRYTPCRCSGRLRRMPVFETMLQTVLGRPEAEVWVSSWIETLAGSLRPKDWISAGTLSNMEAFIGVVQLGVRVRLSPYDDSWATYILAAECNKVGDNLWVQTASQVLLHAQAVCCRLAHISTDNGQWVIFPRLHM